MQATEGAAEVAAPTPEATRPESSQFDQVLGLLQSMSDQIKALGDRVQAVEANAGPRYIPATPETYSAEYDRQQIIDQSPQDGSLRGQKVPVMADGIQIPDQFLAEYPIRFRDGQRVRLNLAVVPHGRTDGKTRGELMADAGVPNLPGQIVYRTFLTRKRQWKYRVQFPRAVMPGAVNGTVQLYESELLPA